MMLLLRVIGGGPGGILELRGDRLSIGRRAESDLQLADASVSRLHARLTRHGEVWTLSDEGSTNGVRVNGKPVKRAALRAGDRLSVGAFELTVEDSDAQPSAALAAGPGSATGSGSAAGPGSATGAASATGACSATDLAIGAPGAEPGAREVPELARATIVRSLAEFTRVFGERGEGLVEPIADPARACRLDAGDPADIFAILTRLGRLLIEAASVGSVLEGVLDVAFDALPVDRGFVLLRDEATDSLRCALMRDGDRISASPRSVPVSHTMLATVVRERVALLTADARMDQRLAATESVHIHQIRAAMCAPLWSGERIIGVIQVDSPRATDSFDERDVDLLTALANYGAVAVERLRNAERAAFERQVRGRLERYHSPAVIEAVLSDEAGSDAGNPRRLRPAEVSVLFADVVGFTGFCADAAPGQVAEVMEAFFERAVGAIFEAGGTLDKFIGDCVMAFFGAPIEQRDHAPRAVTAALAIQAAVAAWNEERLRCGLTGFAVRIGVNSGPVVVGDLGSRSRVDYTVLGNTVNVAARLESTLAEPGDVVIGPTTRALLSDAFGVVSLGPHTLRGLSEALEIFRVLGKVAP